jgi:hypothetical protein
MEDAVGHQQRLSRDPDFDPTFSQLIDLSQVSKIEMTADDVRQLAKDDTFSPHARRAILVASDKAFALAQMFATLRKAQGDTNIGVFRDLELALGWILGRGAPVSSR